MGLHFIGEPLRKTRGDACRRAPIRKARCLRRGITRNTAGERGRRWHGVWLFGNARTVVAGVMARTQACVTLSDQQNL